MAVWRSSDSPSSALRARSSLTRRAFSMAMTAWSAKVFTSSIWLSVNGLTSRRPHPMAPMGTPFLKIGMPRYVR